jgi:hypothetical protein
MSHRRRGAVREAAELSEKIYSFLLKDLAKASADNRSHGHSIAYQAADGLQARGSCWEEKSIHEATRSLTKWRKVKKSAVNEITWVPSSDFVDDSSIHSQFKGAIS